VFDPASRYVGLPTAELHTATGRTIVYVTRRFLPSADQLTPVARVVVTEDDRLDLISARTLGDPLQYWRVCDSNEAMNPEELVDDPGRLLWVATPSS
jgi:hypothetical protein